MGLIRKIKEELFSVKGAKYATVKTAGTLVSWPITAWVSFMTKDVEMNPLEKSALLTTVKNGTYTATEWITYYILHKNEPTFKEDFRTIRNATYKAAPVSLAANLGSVWYTAEYKRAPEGWEFIGFVVPSVIGTLTLAYQAAEYFIKTHKKSQTD
jgi:hypothetical protein